MIPEGWASVPLSQIASSSIVYGIVQAGPHVVGGIPYLKSSNVGGKIDVDTLQCTSPDIHAQYCRSVVRPGDIVISLRGNTGATSIVPSSLIEANLTQGTARISVGEDFDHNFIHQQIAGPAVQRQINAATKGSTFVEITLEDLRKVKVCTPRRKSEQRRIAEILSTWDRAIATVEALIANALAQKQALMQSLLTGKKRLPGFTTVWINTSLDQVAKVLVSNVDKKSAAAEQSVRLCNYMDVYRSDQITANMDFMVATATTDQVRKFGLRVGDVLITKDSETPEDIAIPAYVASTTPDLVCGYHLAIIRPKKGIDGQFLKYFFEHPHTRYFFATRANGATRFGLTIDAITTAPITLPAHDEQRRIAEVIAAAEQEIERLKPIEAALRQEKSALMQQLLTGKRRVIVGLESGPSQQTPLTLV
ncbi:MAG: restriction endonuclease subunit S [Formivibrio sp.]|nr:restriction endonuclease subunit S [Formivibrio sp.]